MPRARTIRRRYDAAPDSVRRARDELARFAAAAGGNGEQVSRVRLAISEGVTNAVVHGYRGAPGEVLITARVDLWGLVIVVRDRGQGLTVAPEQPGLGLGLMVITELTDEMTLAERSRGGTELRMRFALTGPRRARPRGRRRQPAAAAAA
jgi:stage II sporulation protein AB (anti-sigma F factor)